MARIRAKTSEDVGRKHRRQRRLNAKDTSILADYQAVMRAELRRLLRDIRGEFKGLPENASLESLLPIDERAKRWNLAIKLARSYVPISTSRTWSSARDLWRSSLAL